MLCRDPAVPPPPQLLACPSHPRPPPPNAFVLLWGHFPKSSVLQVSDLIVLGTRGTWGKGALSVYLKPKALRDAGKLNLSWHLASLVEALGRTSEKLQSRKLQSRIQEILPKITVDPGGSTPHPKSQTLCRIKSTSEQIMPPCCSLGHHLGKSCLCFRSLQGPASGKWCCVHPTCQLWSEVHGWLCNGLWPPHSCKACQRLAVQGGHLAP